ncbi:MAG TPA: right-handed parallel beta-helix repeat-containing protein [Verrucomicrobiae bacterium]|nr:right-handed parallel beta-helix repeat-containing protein [Verrucomicrobiae bacterium]
MRLLAPGVRFWICNLIFLGHIYLIIPLRSGAATFFVAADGSDANAGTNIAEPFQTLAQAARTIKAGDTCWIRAGTYRETLRPRASGTARAPITFAAYSNEVVIVTGVDLLSGWTSSAQGIYSAAAATSLGTGYDQVFVDGKMAHEARYPHFGAGDLLHPAVASVSVDAAAPNVVRSPAWAGHPNNFWVGAWFSGGLGERWSWQCARVIASAGDTLTVDPASQSQPWFTGTGVGFVWGVRGAPPGDNEWRLENGFGGNTLSLRLNNGADPARHIVEMKRRFWCIDFNGQSYVTVHGLRLRAGAVRLTGTHNLLDDCQGLFLSHYLKYTWGYSFCGDNPAGSGIWLAGTNNVLHGCTIRDTAGSAVVCGGYGNSIVRNRFSNSDYSGTYACALRLEGTHTLVAFNSAHHSGRDLLQPAGAGHSIYLNDLSFPGVLCRDLGAIYVWGVNARAADGVATRIAYNWLHDNTLSGGPSPLIYLDNWCRNFVVDHNVCWNNQGDAGIRINAPAFGHQLYNNTLFNCDRLGTHTYDMWPNFDPDPAFWTRDFYSYQAANTLFLGNAPQEQLMDWAGEDFRLRVAAAGVHAGVAIPQFTTPGVDAPDLGAYEGSGDFWRPGVDGRW